MGSNSRLLALFCALLLVGALCVVGQPPACASGHMVAVRVAEPWHLEAEPGEIVTVSLFVANRSRLPIEILESVDLPEGWELVTSESYYTIDPGREWLRLVSVHIPPTAPAGYHTLTYVAQDGNRHSVLASIEMTVVVRQVAGLRVVGGDVPRRVVAGDTLRARFNVINSGNTAARVLVRVRSSESYPVHPDSVILHIDAGLDREITVEVHVPREMERKVRHILKVSAGALDSDAGAATVSFTTAQEIIPRSAQAHDPYHRVPGAVRTSYVGGHGGAGIQVEYSGRGTLTEEGGSTADFLLRAPDVRDASIYGLHDEYRLEVSGATYNVQVGDALYNLSPLTSWRHLGRGLGIESEFGDWALAASYLRTRWGGPRIDEGTARVRYGAPERLELGLNYLRKAEGSRRDVLSVRATSRPWTSIDLDLEYGFAGGGPDNQAYRARLRGAAGDARYFLERIRAGKSYAGQYTDEVHTVGSLALPLMWGFRLRGAHREYRHSGDLPVGDVSWTQEQVSSLGLKRTFPLGIRAAIDYRDVKRRGGTKGSAFDYETRTVTFGVERPHQTVSVGGSCELGWLGNAIEGRDYDVNRYGLRINFKPNHVCRVSAHLQSALVGSGEPVSRSGVAGVHLFLEPVDRLELEAGFQWRDYSKDAGTHVDELTAGLVYTLPSGHKASGKARWAWFEENREERAVFSLAYEIPVGLRGARKRGTGSIRGTVFDAEDRSQTGVVDAVLLLNDLAVVTDQDGAFAFPSLEPGEYYLMIDRESVGLHRVSTRKLPLRVVVSGGTEATFDLGVVTSGRVDGEVIVERSLNVSGGADQSTGVEDPLHLLVQLSNQSETLQCRTDDAGRFTFEDVRPGRWVLTVDPRGLPPSSEFEEDTHIVEILPGVTSEVTAVVVPLYREIPIVDEGVLRVSQRTP